MNPVATPTGVTVGEVMHEGVVTCPPDASLRTVAGILASHGIHAVVITGSEETSPRPWGVVSDRDVVLGVARGALDRLSARDAATEPAVTVRADLSLRRAADLMSRYATAHVVVVAPGDGRPVGILSSLDVARAATRG